MSRRSAARHGAGASLRRLALAFTALLALAGGCTDRSGVPRTGTQEHLRALKAFHVGLAAYQAGDDERADARFAELTALAPAEPAGWAGWGALALRQGRLEAASQRLERARSLAPDHAGVLMLLGLVHSRAGRTAEAIAVLRQAVEAAPGDAHAATALAEEVERLAGTDADAKAQALRQAVLARAPDNLAAQVEVARLAAKRGDAGTLQPIAQALAARSAPWPPDVREQVGALAEASATGDLRAAALRTTRLRNVLQQVPEYREGLAAIRAPSIAQTPVVAQLVKIEAPPSRPSDPDMGLRFDVRPADDGTMVAAPQARTLWTLALHLDGNGLPVLAKATTQGLALPGGAVLPWPGRRVPPRPEGVLALDHTYDFKTDLVLAGPGGLRVFRQESPARFEDVTAVAGLPAAVIDAAYAGAWAVDIESDGDLDIVLGAAKGEPLVLQNNGDGTFAATRPFTGVAALRQAEWVDLDGDGTQDAALLDGAGRLQVWMNRRHGQYRAVPVPADAGVMRALAAADLGNDGRWDLLAARGDGAIVALEVAPGAVAWRTREVARIPPKLSGGELRLRVADLDNNGADDLLLMRVTAHATADAPSSATAAETYGGAAIWLGDASRLAAHALSGVPAAIVSDVADVDGDGRLDLLGATAGGQAVQAANAGTKRYHWQVVRPRAAQAHGDQRINPHAIGGEVEVRAGTLVQRRPIAVPVVHFGLGEHEAADVVRVHWPNGVMQAEFDAPADRAVHAAQRLKGSCPFLFAHDGTQVRFVKDAVPWGSAIGLRINTIGTAKVEATEEWYRIGRDQLAARDGHYDLRITAELWEVYYYDHFALVAVDHPVGTEVYVDERFAIPPVPPRIVAVETPRPLVGAVDDLGRDVAQLLAADDGRQVDNFGRGQYQGVTRDHFVELDLGPGAIDAGPLALVAHGSLRPTDSSINVALSQGGRWRPRGMSLEVPDGRGGWRTAQRDLGFPAGRRKTVLFDLDGLFAVGVPRRVRIRTNLEIYWDRIQWARTRPDTPVRATPLEPSVADLRYRGYSVLDVPDAGAPEVPDYHRLAGSAARWRDLEGYYTRHGDVRELLRGIDDRYVIMNAGDEMRFLFPAPSAPPEGWLRDFIVKGDGWIKDGDFNSGHSRTVQPLPHHGEQAYTDAAVPLADEWVVRRHARDWDNYHTRYVAGDAARDSMRGAR